MKKWVSLLLIIFIIIGCNRGMTVPKETMKAKSTSIQTDSRLHDIWVLEELNGRRVSLADFTKELPNLEINTSTNQFMGYAGCNRMNGTVFFEKGILRFSKVTTTRMNCGSNNRENEFLKILQSTTGYKVENRHLILINSEGKKMIFKKVD